MFFKRLPSTLLVVVLLSLLTLTPLRLSWAQQQMDLEDLEIKGELLGDNRIQMINRERNKLKNFVEFRTDYRQETTEGLIRPIPIYSDIPIFKSSQKAKNL